MNRGNIVAGATLTGLLCIVAIALLFLPGAHTVLRSLVAAVVALLNLTLTLVVLGIFCLGNPI